MKLCSKCKNSYPKDGHEVRCNVKIDSLQNVIPIYCGGIIVDIHCGVCLDTGYVEIRDPRFPTPEKVACKRGCQQLEAKNA